MPSGKNFIDGNSIQAKNCLVKLTMILDELVTLEVTIIEKVKVMMVLQKLPQSYQELILTVLGMTELSKIDIPYITTLLRNEYECHKNLTGKN